MFFIIFLQYWSVGLNSITGLIVSTQNAWLEMMYRPNEDNDEIQIGSYHFTTLKIETPLEMLLFFRCTSIK